jgi:acetoin utilization protein AcuB
VLHVEKIMSINPVCVSLDDSLATVKSIFDNCRFHHLLVVDEGVLVGVVSDRDLLRAISPNIDTTRYTAQDWSTLQKRVHQISTRHPITLPPEATVLEAVSIFNTYCISCIPIVALDNRPLGILSWRDILKHLTTICCDQCLLRAIE